MSLSEYLNVKSTRSTAARERGRTDIHKSNRAGRRQGISRVDRYSKQNQSRKTQVVIRPAGKD